jgi:phage shock protein PspC (stress-responsive transcriptional regulator)
MSKRLYRSRKDRKIAGVCGGLGEYFNVDPVIFRILWVILLLGAGTGLLAYIIFWLIVPEAPEGSAA